MIDLEFLGNLTVEAGDAILKIYNASSRAEEKDADFPHSLAEKQALQIISRGLQSRYSDIPALSKEGKDIPYSIRKEWPRFWLVNALDAAQGFRERSGEFTVNIALIDGAIPILGLIYLPVQKILYMAAKGSGSWKIDNGVRFPLKVAAPPAEEPIRVAVGRSPASLDVIPLIDLLPRSTIVSRRGALKFCAIAAGEADFYPRLDATWEWETAAGQAIITEAGGVMTGPKGKPLTYNKPELQNGPFLAAPSLAWLEEMDILDCEKRLSDLEFETPVISCR